MVKRLILNADDFGSNPHANEAVFALLSEGRISSSTIMAPAEYFQEAAAWCVRHRVRDVGLHLTLTSEFPAWGFPPLSRSPSLTCDRGTMWSNSELVEEHAEDGEVLAELTAQFSAAEAAGLELSHADNHMGSVYGLHRGRCWLPEVFRLCAANGKLPFRLFRGFYEKDAYLSSIRTPALEAQLGGMIRYGESLGIQFPDWLLFHEYSPEPGETYESFKQMLIDKIFALPDGISETFIHPETPNPEHPERIKRVWEYRFAMDPDFPAACRDAGVELTSYRKAFKG